MTNQPYLLALNRMNGMGPRTIAKLLVKWPQLEELFVLPAPQLEHIQPPLPCLSSKRKRSFPPQIGHGQCLPVRYFPSIPTC